MTTMKLVVLKMTDRPLTPMIAAAVEQYQGDVQVINVAEDIVGAMKAAGESMFVVFDEASEIDPAIWTSLPGAGDGQLTITGRTANTQPELQDLRDPQREVYPRELVEADYSEIEKRAMLHYAYTKPPRHWEEPVDITDRPKPKPHWQELNGGEKPWARSKKRTVKLGTKRSWRKK